jgi:hypothetical protein
MPLRYEDLDSAETVDRGAEGWRLTRTDLRGSYASRIYYRQRGILDAPEGAIGIGDIVEGTGRTDESETKERQRESGGYGVKGDESFQDTAESEHYLPLLMLERTLRPHDPVVTVWCGNTTSSGGKDWRHCPQQVVGQRF